MKMITDTHVNELYMNGYIELPQFLTSEEYSYMIQLANELEVYPEQIGGPMKYFESSQQDQSEIINRVEKFLEISLHLRELVEKKFAIMLNELTNNIYVLFKEKINFKMPGAGGFKPHQDAAAFYKFIRDEMFIVMIPLQNTNIENGYLEVADNYFDRKSIEHRNGMIPEIELQNIQWKGIKQNERDILVFSSYLIHKSESNYSSKSRRCFYITFNNEATGNLRDSYFKYKREHFPPRIERIHNEQHSYWQSKLARGIF